MDIYDLIIIGSGPAGYSASIYASRYKISNIIIGSIDGGMAAEAHKICNYPSEVEITGIELMEKMRKNVEFNQGKIIFDEVVKIKKENGVFTIITRGKKEFYSRTIILALGTKRRKLGIADEDKFLGKGASYCATCDGMFFKDKIVTVIGASDAANSTSLYLSKIAKKVYQIVRKENLRGEVAWIEAVANNPKIEIIYSTNVVGFKGDKKITCVVLDKPYKNNQELATDGVFIEIGSIPNHILFQDLGITTDQSGYIHVLNDQSTNIEGVWAAGDITDGSDGFRQVVTACSEGAVAAHSIFSYIELKAKKLN